MLSDPTVLILMYFVLPLWLIAGFADWLCHRASHIESTTGAKESLIHLLMFVEVGIPLLAAMFLEVNALIIATMLVAFVAHEATAMWDVSYATTARTVSPVEQHVHSFLEMIPLIGIVSVVSLHWVQFQALFGFGLEPARFEIAWKPEPRLRCHDYDPRSFVRIAPLPGGICSRPSRQRVETDSQQGAPRQIGIFNKTLIQAIQ
ncbi:diguanylate cyclase [Mesorhizobium sp. M0621]|uniref:diguanylate cyclase n=1 Tax=Mesorhizobium sp. M0621 TaxID=2956974 RepID=UPI00333D7227